MASYYDFIMEEKKKILNHAYYKTTYSVLSIYSKYLSNNFYESLNKKFDNIIFSFNSTSNVDELSLSLKNARKEFFNYYSAIGMDILYLYLENGFLIQSQTENHINSFLDDIFKTIEKKSIYIRILRIFNKSKIEGYELYEKRINSFVDKLEQMSDLEISQFNEERRKRLDTVNLELEAQKRKMAEKNLITSQKNALEEVQKQMEKEESDLTKSLENLNKIKNYNEMFFQEVKNNNSYNYNEYLGNISSFWNTLQAQMKNATSARLDKMEKLLDADFEISMPTSFILNMTLYVLFLGTKSNKFSGNYKTSAEYLQDIKDIDWSNKIGGGEEDTFKDDFWKQFAVFDNFVSMEKNEFNSTLKDEGFEKMQEKAINAAKKLRNEESLGGIKDIAKKFFYEEMDLGDKTLNYGLYDFFQGLSDLMYELSTPIEFQYYKGAIIGLFESIRNTTVMCLRAALAEGLIALLDKKILNGMSVLDVLNQLKYYNEILKANNSKTTYDDLETKYSLIKQSAEYEQKLSNGFGTIEIVNNLKRFTLLYNYLKNRGDLLGTPFYPGKKSYLQTEISSLNEQEKVFIYLAYNNLIKNDFFDLSNISEEYNTNKYNDEVNKNIKIFFGFGLYNSESYVNLESSFITNGLYKTSFKAFDFNKYFLLNYSGSESSTDLVESYDSFWAIMDKEFSKYTKELDERSSEYIEEKISTLNDDMSVFLMRFSPTINLLQKNFIGKVFNLDNIITIIEDLIKSLFIVINDITRQYMVDIEESRLVTDYTMAKKEWYYFFQALPITIDYIYKRFFEEGTDLNSLLNVGDNKLELKDLEEINKIFNEFAEQVNNGEITQIGGTPITVEYEDINTDDIKAIEDLNSKLDGKLENIIFNIEGDEIVEVVFKETGCTSSKEKLTSKQQSLKEVIEEIKNTEEYDALMKILNEIINRNFDLESFDINLLYKLTNKEFEDYIKNFLLKKEQEVELEEQKTTTLEINFEEFESFSKDLLVEKTSGNFSNTIKFANIKENESVSLRFSPF